MSSYPYGASSRPSLDRFVTAVERRAFLRRQVRAALRTAGLVEANGERTLASARIPSEGFTIQTFEIGRDGIAVGGYAPTLPARSAERAEREQRLVDRSVMALRGAGLDARYLDVIVDGVRRAVVYVDAPYIDLR